MVAILRLKSQSVLLFAHCWRKNSCILTFPMSIIAMWNAISFRISTQITESISYEDYHYTTTLFKRLYCLNVYPHKLYTQKSSSWSSTTLVMTLPVGLIRFKDKKQNKRTNYCVHIQTNALRKGVDLLYPPAMDYIVPFPFLYRDCFHINNPWRLINS